MKLKTLDPLTQICEALARSPIKQSALELTAMCKRAEALLEAVRDEIKEDANQEYLEKVTAAVKEMKFCDGTVTITKYTPRAYWSYPLMVVQLENKLRDMQKQAQVSGEAKKRLPEQDERSTLFAVTVTDKFV